ncbi:C2H2 zinc finger protein [Aspergillus undulatus]|uniref:C2H2 zinc finger protein n=1 Tax=Aspergillus undulatus TaxID=1810928 RepID=UPI003CCD46AF
MAALMQSNNEPVAISNALPASSNPTASSSPDSVAFLKQAKPDSTLTSIASAGLNVTRSKDSLPAMSTTQNSSSTERPLEPIREADQNSSQVAREALGASEKQQSSSVSDSLAMHSDQMQVDHHTAPGEAGEAVFNSAENGTSLMNSSTVASPGPIEDSVSQDGDQPRHRDDSDLHQNNSNKAFSYPMPTGGFNDPRRGLSLPSSGLNKARQRSPSAKKHRCPYCQTEFTRHHNLKSHLLTHSQEKPFVCTTCQSRFRRLHDLKRHQKLHTGERPHICPKCGRRFARGDALARHNKGQGGCAGRRASMGSYAAEDEYGDAAAAGAEDAMDGLVYAEPERMDEEDERRYNMPSIQKHDIPTDTIARSNSVSSYQARQSSTYPPIAANRPSPGGLFPPPTSHGGSSGSPSPISQSGNITFPPANQSSGPSGFAPPAMTESPRPLSPNALSSHQIGHGPENSLQLHHRAHSPGISRPFAQQPYRAPPSASSASGLGLPPPQPGMPQLPPPPGLNSSEPRFSLHSQSSVQNPAAAAKHTPSHSHSSNHGGPLSTKSIPETVSTNNVHTSQDPSLFEQQRDQNEKLWEYIRAVHEELSGLRSEVATLRAQVASSNVNALTTPGAGVTQPSIEAGSASAVQR